MSNSIAVDGSGSRWRAAGEPLAAGDSHGRTDLAFEMIPGGEAAHSLLVDVTRWTDGRDRQRELAFSHKLLSHLVDGLEDGRRDHLSLVACPHPPLVGIKRWSCSSTNSIHPSDGCVASFSPQQPSTTVDW